MLLFPSGRPASPHRLAWGGACFGFAAAVKIWAFAPAVLAGLTAGAGARARPGRAWFAGGFAAGLAVPCLPFLVLAPRQRGKHQPADRLDLVPVRVLRPALPPAKVRQRLPRKG